MSEQNRRAVPKFASFRPKSPQATAGEETRKKPATEHESKRDRERGQSRRHRHDQTRRHRTPSSRQPPAADQPLHDEKKLDVEAVFIEDRKGDPEIVKYGINRYAIPRFYRSGAGNVIGLPTRFRIDRDHGDDKTLLVTEARRGAGSKREKYVFAKSQRQSERLLKIKPDVAGNDGLANQTDFLLLTRKKQPTDSDVSDNESSHYRSIEGKAKHNSRTDDPNLEYASESESDEMGRTVTFDDVIKQRSIELSRAVKSQPGNIDAWLALIAHQDVLLGLTESGGRKPTTAEIRSTADIKISMYETALEKAGRTLANREKLLIGIMEEGEKIWDLKEQTKRWNTILKENMESNILWKRYLDFQQTYFAGFRYDQVRDVYSDRIKLLTEALDNRTYADLNAIFDCLVYTLLRATVFIREAGYVEVAVAIWQATLEVNLFGPVGQPAATTLELLRDFWDSEVPRIGEPRNQTWKDFLEDPNSSSAPDPKDDEPRLELGGSFAPQRWLAAEHHAAQAAQEPARTLDEVHEDPFRVVMFSDIEAFIILLPLGNLPHLHDLLIDAFLIFCQLPPLSFDTAANSWWQDQFLRGELMAGDDPYSSSGGHNTASTVHDSGVPAELLNQFGWSFAVSPSTLYPVGPWFSCVSNWNVYDLPPVKISWLKCCLQELMRLDRSSRLRELYLAFEWVNDPASIKKMAKGLIKSAPTNLLLYNAYAAIEWARGNNEIAQNVLMSALSMQSSLPEHEQKHAIYLWRTWVWAYLKSNRQEEALKVILRIADGRPDATIEMTPSRRIKARRYLVSMRDHNMSAGDWQTAVAYCEVLALLEFLIPHDVEDFQAGRNIDSALAIFDAASESFAARKMPQSVHRESLHQLAAQLLCYYVETGPFRPALIRTHLQRSIQLFPHNTLFLSVFSWNEARVRIDDRVRSILHSYVLTDEHDSCSGRLFTIQHELRSGNAHSTRAAFESAVTSPVCRSHAGVWRLYLMFCLRNHEYRRCAREVFYRGVRACPWAKRLYLMAFDSDIATQRILDDHELRDAYRILGEKELRVLVEVDEALL